MLQFCNLYVIDAKGRVVRKDKDKVYYDPNLPPALTSVFNDSNRSATSAAGLAICNTDVAATYRTAFCREAPVAMLELIAADDTGKLAVNYRRYIRHMMLPTTHRIMGALMDHSAV